MEAEGAGEVVLIAGCGYVGSALARILVKQEREVWGLRRRAELLPDGVRAVHGDVLEADDLAPFPDSVSQVVYAISPDTRDVEAYRRAYVQGLERLLERLERDGSPLARVVLVTSTAVYGERSGEWVDEETPAEPRDFRGRILLESEEVLRQAQVPGVILRLGGIYGPGRTRTVDRVRNSEAQCGPGPAYTNRIHRDDAAGALAHLLFHSEPRDLYVGVDEAPEDRCVVYRWLADALGVPPPDRGGEGGPGGATGKRCSSRRLQRSGYRFVYPTFREGYAALL